MVFAAGWMGCDFGWMGCCGIDCCGWVWSVGGSVLGCCAAVLHGGVAGFLGGVLLMR